MFGVVRSALVAEVSGKLSGLMSKVLLVFFAERGHSFTRGIVVNIPPASAIVITAVFMGFLADLLAHKHILDWKGAGITAN